MKKIFYKIVVIPALFCLTSCMNDDILPVSVIDLYGSRGVFIVNEGNYLYGNSSLTYYDFETQKVINNLYSAANGVPLGDIAYSMQIYQGKGYIVVNNSGCIHVVDANNLLHLGTIEGLPSPRNILFLGNNIALVSDLYARGISIVNTNTLEVTGKINTGGTSLPFYQHPTENLIKIGGNIFTNCWSFDNKVLVISAETLSVIDSITVGIQPLAMVKDKNNNLWVINDGGYSGNPFGWEKPSLMMINSTSLKVEKRMDFSSLNDLVGPITINTTGDSLYFIRNHIYKMHIDESSLPSEPLILGNGNNFRTLSTDPLSGDLFIADAVDFLSEGRVYRYKSDGNPVDTINVGIIPGGFCFN